MTSVESIPAERDERLRGLPLHGITNVTLEVGDVTRSWSKQAPSVIVLTGSEPVLAEEFQRSLKPGGWLLRGRRSARDGSFTDDLYG